MKRDLAKSEDGARFILVATPIGNLSDITYRAVETLKECDVIVCEDTLTTKKLIYFYSIKNKDGSNKTLVTFHANSNEREINRILELLEEDKIVAYVSDAGTPTISDPGVLLVNLIREKLPHVSIETAPGVSAVVMAYSLSGAVGNEFTFYGFIPHKKGRETMIREMLQSPRTGIVYESVHRIINFLEKAKAIEERLLEEGQYKNRELVICRELTKIYEEAVVGNVEYCLKYFEENPEKVRGEFVIVVK
jgi:16S rRNA (cytidine1402-2'-O)-methyltransferase